MSVGAPWSVKGIDPKAREIAKDLARRSNMTLGDWLNQMILEDITSPDTSFGQSPEPAPRQHAAASEPAAAREMARVAAALERLTARMETAESRSTLAISGIDQSVHGLLSRLEGTEREHAQAVDRVEGAVEEVRTGQDALAHRVGSVEATVRDQAAVVGRMRDGVDALRNEQSALVGRLSAAETADQEQAASVHRLRDTLDGIRQDQMLLSGRVSTGEAAERERAAVAQRLQGAIAELHTEATTVAERLDRVEEELASPKVLEPLNALETALGKVAAHLYESDGRARDAEESLRGDLDHMSERVARLDAAVEDAPTAELIEGVVAKIMQRLHDAEARTSSAIHDLEASFAGLDHRLRAGEQRPTQPDGRLEQLAADLARNFDEARVELAEKLRATADARFDAVDRSLREMTDHVGQAERRSAQAIERMGHEVLRMAGNLNNRMEGVESRSARAIEQVGGDVARIADTVEQRFRRADALQAESLEKLGAEISRITERLSERIGNSERRSAQAIDDVGEQVNRVTERLSQKQDRASGEIADRIRQSEERTARLLEEAREKIDQRLADTQKRLEAAASAPAAPAARPAEDFDLYRDDDLEPGPFSQERYAPAPVAARAPAPPTAALDPFEDDAFGAFPGDAQDAPEAVEPPAAHPPLAIAAEAEPAAATFEDDDADFGPVTFGHSPNPPEAAPVAPPPGDAGEDMRPTTTRELIERARAAARAASNPSEERGAASKAGGSTLFSGFSIGRKKKPASSVATALKVSVAFAALGVTALGYTLISAESASHGRDAKTAANPADASAGLAAVALNPTPLTGAGAPTVETAPVNAQAQALYADAVRRLEAKDFTALPSLRRAASLGEPQAQLYLAGLYESGGAGLHKDMAEARRWTERAAQGGDRKAMHNLASYYFEGAGGPRNATAAVQWFRRAADLGMTDSQYNLAQLYERGVGVSQNAAEAYKWYLIAARSGDAESLKSAERMKALISADARSTAERAALAYRPPVLAPAATPALAAGTAAPAGPALAGGRDLVLAQKALSQLGYYRGPQDGVSSPALRMAIAAYQKEQGLPATGAMDAALTAKFTAIAG